MITSTLKLATSTTFHGLRALAMSVTLVSLGAISLALVTLGVPDVAKGQNRVRTYSQTEVERLIRDVEQSSREFQRDFDTWLDRSPIDGQQREDRYNRQVQRLTSALSSLRSNFDSRNDWWLARSDLQRVLNAATPINSLLRSREVGGRLDRQWGRLRRNLDRLAAAFNLPPVGSTFTGNQPGYPELGGNVRNCSTTGTYRGYTNTGESELTIAGNGTATIRSLNSNAIYSGRCANDVLYFDWGAFNLVRSGRNISTVEIGNTANRTTYRRVSGNYGDVGQGYPGQGYPTQTYPGQTYPEQVGNVPNWAIGSFRGVTDSGETELTIAPNGAATVRSLNTNSIHYGRYANDVLTFDWGSFRVVREGRGISTVELSNQQNRTTYRRIN
jgi:hypothetical protein